MIFLHLAWHWRYALLISLLLWAALLVPVFT